MYYEAGEGCSEEREHAGGRGVGVGPEVRVVIGVIQVALCLLLLHSDPGPPSGQTWPRRPDRDCYRREWGLCPPPPPS